jgi:hypothetical protein
VKSVLNSCYLCVNKNLSHIKPLLNSKYPLQYINLILKGYSQSLERVR